MPFYISFSVSFGENKLIVGENDLNRIEIIINDLIDRIDI